MTTDILERMDDIVARAGTCDPYELADYLHAYVAYLIGKIFHKYKNFSNKQE